MRDRAAAAAVAALSTLAIGGAYTLSRLPASGSATSAGARDDVQEDRAHPSHEVALPTGVHSVVALGDSVPSGAGGAQQPYPQRVRAALAPTNPGVTVTNLASDGMTATALQVDLTQNTSTRSAVAGADIVLVTVGANDLYPALQQYQSEGCDAACSSAATRDMSASLTAALRLVASLDQRHGRRILVTTYWNVFKDGEVGRSREGSEVLQWSDALTRSANTAICAAAKTAGATCVDLYEPFKRDGSDDPTKLLAADGDHPDDDGHAVIADAVVRALRT